MNIFSKTNRSTADAAAKVMAEQPAKVNDYKPHEPSADTSMVNRVVATCADPHFGKPSHLNAATSHIKEDVESMQVPAHHLEPVHEKNRIDELNKSTLASYRDKAGKDVTNHMSALNTAKSKGDWDNHINKAQKRYKGLATAGDKFLGNKKPYRGDREELDEAADLHVSKSEDPDYYKVTSVKHPKLKSNLAVGDTIHKNILKNNEYNGYSVKKLGEEVVDHLGAYKAGTRVLVGGKRGEISYVHHSSDPAFPHDYKITDIDANDPYKQKRLENGNFIPHHRIRLPVKEDNLSGGNTSNNDYSATLPAPVKTRKTNKLGQVAEWMKDSGWHKRGKDVVTDKSGAKHTQMSRVRDLARRALKKNAEKKAKIEVSHKGEIKHTVTDHNGNPIIVKNGVVMRANEETLDELSKDTLKSYIEKTNAEQTPTKKIGTRISGLWRANKKLAQKIKVNECILHDEAAEKIDHGSTSIKDAHKKMKELLGDKYRGFEADKSIQKARFAAKKINVNEEINDTVDKDGKLNAKGEAQLAKYKEEQEENKRRAIIAKHSGSERVYNSYGTHSRRTTLDFEKAHKELKAAGLIGLKEAIEPYKRPEATEYKTSKELHDAVPKAIFRALIKHPVFRDKHVRYEFGGNTSTYSHIKHGENFHQIEVHTHPYLTTFHVSKGSRGPGKVSAYHHMIAGKEKRDGHDVFHTLKTHGYEHDVNHIDEHIVKIGSKYRLLSHKGKNLGTFDSHAAAAKHEGEVEWFKHNKEEVEQIDEIGDTFKGRMKLRSYIKKAGKSESRLKLLGTFARRWKDRNEVYRNVRKRITGVGYAKMRLAKEETIDEISKSTLKSYRRKAGLDLVGYGASPPRDEKEDRKAQTRSSGIERAEKKLKEDALKEETEMNDEILDAIYEGEEVNESFKNYLGYKDDRSDISVPHENHMDAAYAKVSAAGHTPNSIGMHGKDHVVITHNHGTSYYNIHSKELSEASRFGNKSATLMRGKLSKAMQARLAARSGVKPSAEKTTISKTQAGKTAKKPELSDAEKKARLSHIATAAEKHKRGEVMAAAQDNRKAFGGSHMGDFVGMMGSSMGRGRTYGESVDSAKKDDKAWEKVHANSTGPIDRLGTRIVARLMHGTKIDRKTGKALPRTNEDVEQIDEALDHEVNKYANHVLSAHSSDDLHVGNEHREEAHNTLKHIEKNYGPVGVRWAEARAAEHIENHNATEKARIHDVLKANYKRQRNLVDVKESIEEPHVNVRQDFSDHYAKMYAKHFHHATQVARATMEKPKENNVWKHAEADAYNFIETKHGKAARDHLASWHNQNKKLDEDTVEEGFVNNIKASIRHVKDRGINYHKKDQGYAAKDKASTEYEKNGKTRKFKKYQNFAVDAVKKYDPHNNGTVGHHEPVKEELKVGEKDEDTKSRMRRKYLGSKRGRTATGSKAHAVDVEPSLTTRSQ